jgi:hypothetical protein
MLSDKLINRTEHEFYLEKIPQMKYWIHIRNTN